MQRSGIASLLWMLITPITLLFAQDWQAPLSIQVDGWSDTFYLGCCSGASDGYDARMDMLAPPPAFGPYAIFYIAAFPNYLKTDIRRSEPGATWNLRTFNCSGKIVKIKWDLQTLDAAASGQLRLDGLGIITIQDRMVRSGDLDLKIELIIDTGAATPQFAEPPASFSLAIFPNPARDHVSIILKGTPSQKALINSLLGMQIKEPTSDQTNQGSASFHWDRKDDAGRLVPDGVYWIRTKTNYGFI